MYLRKLEIKDAPLMLEWMHNDKVVHNLNTNFSEKTINDCLEFIENSLMDKINLNLAIASDNDEYMGTVSLKHIDRERNCAEFAITVRECAMGRGYSWFGMSEIMHIAFEKENLDFVYWCVSKSNQRACRFYDKHHFKEYLEVPDVLVNKYKNKFFDLKWYILNRDDEYSYRNRKEVLGCKIINISTIETAGAGQLSFFESNKDFTFGIKRIYYITNVPEGVRRGFHAHKELKQILFCPYGKIDLILDDGKQREEIILDSPSIGVLIEKPIWREMVWIQKDSVLCVGASEKYNAEDYIRDYGEFLNLVKENK